MSTENSKKTLTEQRATEGHKNAMHLVSFFFTYTAKEITENAEKFKFWKNVLFEKRDLDNADCRKELIRIEELLDALSHLSSKFTSKQIQETIRTLDAMLLCAINANAKKQSDE